MSWGRSWRRSPGPAVFIGTGDPLQQQKIQEEHDANMTLQTIETNCQLIASQAEHLQRMRSSCATTAQLTQQEIRNVEEKLVKLFSMQLVSKLKLPPHIGIMIPPELQMYPSLRQWLEVVGLSKDVVEGISSDVKSLQNLLDKDDCELNNLLCKHGSDTWEIMMLVRSVGNLKRYTEVTIQGKEDEFTGSLYWDSWEHSGSTSSSSFSSLSRTSHRAQRSSVSSSEGEGGGVMDGSYASSGIGRSSDDSNPSSPPLNLPLLKIPNAGGMIMPSNIMIHHSVGNSFQDRRYTPPSTPPVILKNSKVSGDRKFPTTPPPCKKNMLQNTIKQLQTQQQLLQQQIQQQQQSALGRSTSHESQLSHRLDHDIGALITMDHLTPRRTRLQSDSGAETVMYSDVSRSPERSSVFYRESSRNLGSCGDFSKEHRTIHSSPLSSKLASPTRINCQDHEDDKTSKYSLDVPLTPRFSVSGSMSHNVRHRFTRMTVIKLDKCGFCDLKIPLFGGVKCKECSFKCHKECEPKVAPSCGLPKALLDYFTNKVKSDLEQSSKLGSHGILNYGSTNYGISSPQLTVQTTIPSTFVTHDSGSNTSSCNSSTPSSPALLTPHSSTQKSKFTYSDLSIDNLYQQCKFPIDMKPWVNFEPKITPPLSSQNVLDGSHDSDKTVSTSGSGSTGTDDSDRTVGGRVDSQDSAVSDGETNDPKCIRQNSVSSVTQSLKEWDIPYDELDHGEIVGVGRFGKVYSGNWHGKVAIKELNMEYINDEKALEAFRAEVSTFRKTRHENLVLFMGACMKPPRLAIVTSLCQGITLFRHIHTRKDKFPMSRTVLISKQIAQGMGYLHARGIVHKDLKTKNIFLENKIGKIVITDFGLFNVTRLCYDTRRSDWLSIPPGWLCYLAPEIMRSLKHNRKPEDSLPFTVFSDIYAFGTVLYELLCGEWPHVGLPPEAVIWQVGRGIKPSLAHVQASRDVKNILMASWSYAAEERKEFSAILNVLSNLPKKRLGRSPSQPVQLSRSAESVF